MSSKLQRITAYALAGCWLCLASGAAQSQEQAFIWRGETLTVPMACLEWELSFIIITPENAALCSHLSPEMTDAFNFALADDNPENDPVAFIDADWDDGGPATTGSISPAGGLPGQMQ